VCLISPGPGLSKPQAQNDSPEYLDITVPIRTLPAGQNGNDGMKIGFIGLGRMGHYIAANLLKAGHSVTVWNRSQAPVQALAAKGASAAAAPQDALQGEAVFSMLSNDQVMRDVGLAGPLLDKAAKGLIHVNLATISVGFAKELSAAHTKAGLGYISAPVFGRPEMAQSAQLVLVAGGDAAVLGTMQPVFDVIGTRTVQLDAPEKANLFKIAGNFMIAAELESTGESFALLRKGGVDPALFHDVLSGRLFTGAVFKNYGTMILNRQYEPAGFALTLGLKDVNLARAAAEGLGVTMPTAELLKTHFDEAVSWGWQDRDWSAIGEVPAKKAGV
jgi:3-hydroxyisobutyrate dehydrogenase-like beta-hydroxyacid dehydrogenase